MEKFDLVVPDGMPLVWYLNRLFNAGLKDRVYGPDLMRHSLAASDPTHRHFLLGGTEEERQRLEQVLRDKYPRARVSRILFASFWEVAIGEDEKIIGLLRDMGPNFVWVGLGCPKQELLLARLKARLAPGCLRGRGSRILTISGTVQTGATFMGSAWDWNGRSVC